MRSQINELLQIVREEVSNAKKHAQNTHNSAVEITASARHSPSQSGDRVHATNQATITAQRYEQLRLLMEELESSLDTFPSSVKVPCYVRLRRNDEDIECYVVSIPLYIQGKKILSGNSLLGSKLVSRNVGDTVSIAENDWVISEIG